MISIIIPTYNRLKVLKRAINSVISQKYKNWELIIVDDGSTDNTLEYLKFITKKNSKIKYLIHEKNKGFLAARNTGIKKAKGDWILYLDSDDYYHKNSLSIIASELNKFQKKVEVAFFTTDSLDNNKKVINWTRKYKNNNLYYFPSYGEIVLKNRIFSQEMHITIKTEIAKNNLFNENNPGFETLHYSNLAKKGIKFIFINKNVLRLDYSDNDHISYNRYLKWPLKFAKSYEEFIINHFTVLMEYPETLYNYYIIIGKCYLYAKKLIGLYWIVRAFLFSPKYTFKLFLDKIKKSA